ncbi:TPA: hypothetical protein JBL19_15590 [Legionella pneumophila]|uniref:hypothetical protein n=1 Tax=Legionella pneumophila TaxID=446 RepID=UPI0007878C9B|nr:hypothetical protein [Legionella pneumophila]MDW8878172.1 hypothetical protein [Legionella pneumophila subsp. fraseri]MDW8962088.1 hypothetical protein [Legionella pneumophila subsp. fraseri]MDW9037039.1 hypothetical protein [Legionella pneumophila subsp. fraseri]MDW9038766.1 hypothetical protein [Legionella pneumophila subsp. fraseri]MDW9043233.1 hypothetical protein [Legionella pneumophila subsp. fraseri]
MNVNSENTQPGEALTTEDYSKAMNFIGQNLLSSLTQSVEKLPPQLRNRRLVCQALSAFLTNVIYKQFPEHRESCQQMLDDITKHVSMQLDKIPQSSK